MASAKYQSQSDETKIDVFVRCRGRNEKELRENSSVVVKTDGVKGKTLDLSMGPNAPNNKTYSFDAVFSPLADQQMIFDEIVVPVLDEVRKGFNCTIFAYGQTGSGKTYTMSGDITERTILSDDAGIIPRVLRSMFQGLDVVPNSVTNGNTPESSVKVSFIELYNEELRDLLSTEEKSNLKIFDGDGKKGGGTIVQGMEEKYIANAKAGLQLLRTGSHKRQVAATKCNDLSSRSHTIFTLTVYTKKTLISGEEILSSGKLNLVDLAGSENIGRSGAENKRATEAGLINKSLLTLGRVINALVDRSSHIPYRESKLTRILQDSLGGRTKTCIIATLSPARLNLEETISSLDYAFRAKNIRNKPQLNQVIPKWTFLKDFTTEIERLKSELAAARQRNGVHLSSEAYEQLLGESESLKVQVKEQREKIETIESKLSRKGQDLLELAGHFDTLQKDNEIVRESLDSTQSLLEAQRLVLVQTKHTLAQEIQMRQEQERTAKRLSTQNRELNERLKRATAENTGLHHKLRRTSELQARNQAQHHTLQKDVSTTMSNLDSHLANFRQKQSSLLALLSESVQSTVESELKELTSTRTLLTDQTAGLEKLQASLAEQVTRERSVLDDGLEELKMDCSELKRKIGVGLNNLDEALSRIPQGAMEDIQAFHIQLQCSYTQLGEEYATIFNSMSGQIVEKGETLKGLKDGILAANRRLYQDQSYATDQLAEFVAQEKIKRNEETENLLKRIQELVEINVQQQELRLATIESNSDSLYSNLETYDAQTDIFENGGDQILREWTKIGDDLHQVGGEMNERLQRDYATAVQQTESLKAATSIIHKETSEILQVQREELEQHSRTLEDAISTVQTKNEGFGVAEAGRLSELAAAANTSSQYVNVRLIAASKRVDSIQPTLTAKTDGLEGHLLQLGQNAHIRNDVTELRERCERAKLDQYISTGQTPGRGRYRSRSESPETSDNDEVTETIDIELVGQESSSPRRMSPSKMLVFVDERDSPDTQSKETRSETLDSPSIAPGLRELDVNSMIRSTEGNSMIRSKEGNSMIRSTEGNGLVISKSAVCLEKPDLAEDMFVKPLSLKRAAVNDGSHESKVPTKTRRLRNNRAVSVPVNMGSKDLVDTENRPILASAHNPRKQLSSSTSRRLRSYEKAD